MKNLSLLVLVILFAGCQSEPNSNDYLNEAKDLIALQNYYDAKRTLLKIQEGDPLFMEADSLFSYADSMRKVQIEEERIIQEKRNAARKEAKRKELIDRLNKEIAEIDKGINFNQYRGTIDALQLELVMFGAYASIIRDANLNGDDGIEKLATRLRSKVSRIQVQQFPLLRKEYVKILNKKLWEADVEVFSNGSRYTTINFTGGLFAANKNKKDFQNEIHQMLKDFRFRESRYRWYEYDDEYTYWKVYSGKDSDPVNF